MAEKSVTIRISVTDNFSSVMNKYQQAMGKAVTDTKNLDDASKRTASGGLTGLNNTLNNLMGVFAGMKILDFAGDMITLGNAANATEATFNALTGSAASARNTLNALRQATGGVVADTELMAGANRLLAMNIATTGQQAAELSGIAVNLGRAFGQDAASAIENFSLMLANQSYLRLDSLGISAGAVRARVAELKDEFPEMDKQARFTQATMEEAAKTVDRLGDSFKAAQTPVQQLATKFENFKTDAGQAMAGVVNTALTTLDQLVQISQMTGDTLDNIILNAVMNPDAYESQQGIITSAKTFAERWGQAFADQLGTVGMPSDFNATAMLQRIGEAQQTLGVGATPEQLVQQAGEDMWYSQDQIDRMKQVYAFILANAPVIEEQNRRVRESEMARFNAFMLAQTAQGQLEQGNWDAAMNAVRFGGLQGTTSAQESEIARFQAMMTSGGAPDRTGLSLQGYADSKMFQFENNTSGIGKFLDPAQLDDIKARFEELQDLNERGLISDESLEKAEAFKTKAEEAAAAFEKMSLTDIFGQTSGGTKGEIGDMVINAMKARGATDEEVTAAQQQFDLGSGRQTDASMAMQNQVAPMIASLPPDQQQKAIDNINAFLEMAAKMNLNPQQIAAGLPGAAGFMTSGAGGSFTVGSGQTLSEISAQTGIPVDQLLAATGASKPNQVQPGTYNLGTGYTPIPGFNAGGYAQTIAGGIGPAYGMGGAPNPFVAAGFMTPEAAMMGGDSESTAGASPFDSSKQATDDIKTNVDDISTAMGDVVSTANDLTTALDAAAAPRQVKFEAVVVDRTNGLLSILVGGLAVGNLSTAGVTNVRDNGGRVPGVDSRVTQRAGVTT